MSGSMFKLYIEVAWCIFFQPRTKFGSFLVFNRTYDSYSPSSPFDQREQEAGAPQPLSIIHNPLADVVHSKCGNPGKSN